MYWASGISIFLINISDSSIQKQIFNGVAILAYSKYFLGCLQPCLTGARETKLAEDDLAACSIKGISTGDVFIWSIYINAGLSNINSWLSIK